MTTIAWSDLLDSSKIDQWKNVVNNLNPLEAAQCLRSVLESNELEKLKEIASSARRVLVDYLVSIAWEESAFCDAAMALALLSLSETESWANNATEEFLVKFQLALGATKCPYPDRLPVLKELLSSEMPAKQCLGVKALTRVWQRQTTRIILPNEEAQGRKEWEPQGSEVFIYMKMAADLLQESVPQLANICESDVRDGIANLFWLNQTADCKTIINNTTRIAVERFPEIREPLRRLIWQELSLQLESTLDGNPNDSSHVRWLKDFHSSLEDKSERGRVRQAIIDADWHEPMEGLKPAATMLASNRSLIAEEWEWLTSGEADSIWYFGVALSEADPCDDLLSFIVNLPNRGKDLRVISGYLSQASKNKPENWLDDWIDTYEVDHPDDIALIFDVTWRCAHTTRGATRIARLLREQKIDPRILGSLGFGGWVLGPDINAIRDLLEVMLPSPDLRLVGLALISQRIDNFPKDLDRIRHQARQLLLNGGLPIVRGSTDYKWHKIAIKFAKDLSTDLSAIILNEITSSRSSSWFLSYDIHAIKVLKECINANPTGVWKIVQSNLESENARLFVIGFPSELLDNFSSETILEWAHGNPETRVSLLARIAGRSYSQDSLESKLLDRYGNNTEIGNAFLAAFISGSWSGPTSSHYKNLAAKLEEIAGQATSNNLKSWATKGASDLREYAKERLEAGD